MMNVNTVDMERSNGTKRKKKPSIVLFSQSDAIKSKQAAKTQKTSMTSDTRQSGNQLSSNKR